MNNCNYSVYNANLCDFNLDCINNAGSFRDTDNCNSKNINNEKANPVLLCNYEKASKMNQGIFERNFPANKMCILPDFRGEYKVCAEYKSLNTKTKCPHIKKNDLNPGKGSGVGYLSNIDIDSDLRIGYRSTLCPKNKYIQPVCDRIVVDNPYILDNPTCQNYKYYEFPEKIQQYKSKCKTNSEGVRLDLQNNGGRKTLLKQCKSDINDNGKLQLGPERTNHTSESVWSNLTRRKNI